VKSTAGFGEGQIAELIEDHCIDLGWLSGQVPGFAQGLFLLSSSRRK